MSSRKLHGAILFPVLASLPAVAKVKIRLVDTSLQDALPSALNEIVIANVSETINRTHQLHFEMDAPTDLGPRELSLQVHVDVDSQGFDAFHVGDYIHSSACKLTGEDPENRIRIALRKIER